MLVLAANATALYAGLPHALKHENHHEIDQLEDQWRNAILKGDVAVLGSLLADDYIAITPNGTLQSKEETLAIVRNGSVHFATIEVSDRRVRFYGSTAVVTSRAEVTGSSAGKEITGSFRYTRVYVRDAQEEWKIVSFEASRIRAAGEHK